MTVIWTRVDEKLIHGQVVVAWVPHLNIDTIIIADQDTKNDDWSKNIMKLSIPPEIQTIIFTCPSQVAEILKDEALVLLRILILFKSIESFIAATEAGFQPGLINLGNQACQSSGECIRLTDTFYVTDMELATLASQQRSKGLQVILQSVPNGQAVQWKHEAR